MTLPELPQHAAEAATRAHHGVFGTVIALAAVVATVAVLAFTDPVETRAPVQVLPPPGHVPETALCEPDGTYCEPEYLLPPTENTGGSGRLPEGMLSGRSTPAG